MKVDISKFESVVKRATMDGVVDYLHMEVTRDTIKAKLVNTERNAVSILNLLNSDIFIWEEKDKVGEFVLDFDNPAETVLRFLDNIEEEFGTFSIKKEAVELGFGGMKVKLCLAYPQEGKIFGLDAPKSAVKPFVELRVTDEVRLAYAKIKKLAKKSEKFYITAEGGKLLFESGDKSNSGVNEVKVEICDLETDGIKVIQLGYSKLSAVIELIGRSDDFVMHICYIPEKSTGMVAFVKDDGTEKYYLMGKQDD